MKIARNALGKWYLLSKCQLLLFLSLLLLLLSGPITSQKIDGDNGNSDRYYFGGAQKSVQMVTAAMKLKDAYSLEEKL